MIRHALVGYGRDTDLIVVEYPLPAERIEAIKFIARVDADDPEAAYCYPLNCEQVAEIAGVAGIQPKAGPEYFLEPIA